MGYTTKFAGYLRLSRRLTIAEARLLLLYADDSRNAPAPNPGGYLQWVPSASLDTIGWDGNEKFYNYVEWLRWVCAWLKDAGIAANGSIVWFSEEVCDTGTITVIENFVRCTKNNAPPPIEFRPLTMAALADMALKQVTA